MTKVSVSLNRLVEPILRTLRKPGILLVSVSKKGKPNIMSIGWGFIGVPWGVPTFVAFVRPSRYTHTLIESSGDFTVNMPAKGMEHIVSKCGSLSGRNVDKFIETGLISMPSRKTKSPIIMQCIAHLECSVIYKFPIEKGRLSSEIKRRAYPHGDYHDVYFGKILAAYADKRFESNIP